MCKYRHRCGKNNHMWKKKATSVSMWKVKCEERHMQLIFFFVGFLARPLLFSDNLCFDIVFLVCSLNKACDTARNSEPIGKPPACEKVVYEDGQGNFPVKEHYLEFTFAA
eukprot:TRINITY_DN14089_c0_g1_i1.p1 TRINITY_DN14089_c0_g1~~TRINITY_DN14089_c0_g1_i1.p1  ORF type:complete len:110 (+),score=3.83 TRINITY_DN14089_c0_g1_i1:769-1098(+)